MTPSPGTPCPECNKVCEGCNMTAHWIRQKGCGATLDGLKLECAKANSLRHQDRCPTCGIPTYSRFLGMFQL